MSDLTGFLLARIAEDESSVMLDALARPRLLAECEAKRRTLEVAQLFGCANAVARYLAVPYADHPDYREEWRP